MRGGARPGAGRKTKPEGEKKIHISIYVKPNVAKMMKERGVKASDIIENYFKGGE